MASKDEFLLSMLQTSATNRALITEIGADDKDSCSECAFNDPSSSGGPSLLEQMMAAQQEAKRALDSVKQEERKKASGSFGNGFKKGFLSSSKPKKSESSSPKTETPTTIRAHIPKSTASNFVIKEVQDAMVEEPNPILNQLKAGDWMTPDLISKIKESSVLMNGLQSPKCMAALQLMQTNPKECKKKFERDVEVNMFLQEFGRLMGAHFESMAPASSVTNEDRKLPPVQEIGPLHAEAIQKSKTSPQDRVPAEDAKVQEILQDPELRELLMDTSMQTILRECSDPVKFQRYMMDPIISSKIRKLFAAGLVNTTS